MRSLKPDKAGTADLTSAALNAVTTITKACKLDEILFKASVAITETITITIDSAQGASYDTLLKTIPLVADTNASWRPDGEMHRQAGDQIRVQCTNANTTGSIYYTIKTSELVGG